MIEKILKPVKVSQNREIDNQTFIQSGPVFINKFVAAEKKGQRKLSSDPEYIITIQSESCGEK